MIKDTELEYESKPQVINDILTEKFEKAFDQPTQAFFVHDIAKIAAEHSAVDLAINATCLPLYARVVLFKYFNTIEEKIEFIINAETSTRVAIFREMTDKEISQMVSEMPPDEAVEVLEDLAERRCCKVIECIEQLDSHKARRIREIEKNARNTAGRLMTNEFFSFPLDATIEQVATFIRNKPGIDLTSWIFVIDAEGQLQGYVPARNLLVKENLSLKQVMRPILHKVTVDASREEVVELVDRYKICALPVVNEQGHLIGVIAYEDVLDAFQDILEATAKNVAGTNEKISENQTSFKRFLSRSPWLMVTLFAGFINVAVMSSFNNSKGVLTFALFFVPLITGMSGNIGIQCSTVLVRSMALGLITPKNRRRSIFRELRMGLFAAIFFGTISSFLVYFIDFTKGMPPLPTCLIVSVGLFGACLAGTVLGVISPFFFARMKIDPAVASGPIVTAFNDFFSMSIYFLIAIGMSALLL